MNLFCTEQFKVEYEKLLKKNSYKGIEAELIDYFFDKTIQELCAGVNLNNNTETPFIKKRLNGRGGFRIYYYLIIKNDTLYFMFVHPKTGDLGAENITDEAKTQLYKNILKSIETNNLFIVSRNAKKLVFENI